MTRTNSLASHREQAANAAANLADTAEQSLRSVRERVIPAASEFAAQAEDLAYRGYDAVRNSTQDLRERARDAGDRSIRYARDAGDRGVRYAREEPLKTALIAVAAGAVLVAIARLVSYGRERY